MQYIARNPKLNSEVSSGAFEWKYNWKIPVNNEKLCTFRQTILKQEQGWANNNKLACSYRYDLKDTWLRVAGKIRVNLIQGTFFEQFNINTYINFI
jgi:hypothetical protein